MEKPIIGVISNRSINNSGRSFLNTTNYSNLVCEKIARFNGSPIGIFMPYNKVDYNTLNLCDGFVFQGGNKIESSQIAAAYYAIQNGIPVLGICNGMQTLAALYVDYAGAAKEISPLYLIDDVIKQKGDKAFLYPVAGHNKENPFYIQNIENAKHDINISKFSRLHDVLQTEKMNVASLHNYAVREEMLADNPDFFVSARSSDGVIEAIEIKDPSYFCLGVQYHIELDNENDNIFRDFINESNKTMKLRRK